jgi:hypothetical protein
MWYSLHWAACAFVFGIAWFMDDNVTYDSGSFMSIAKPNSKTLEKGNLGTR